MREKQTIIGIDGGATNISGAFIKKIDKDTFTIFGEICTIYHSENPLYDKNFYSADLDIQSEEMDNPFLKISEEKQGLAILENYENMLTTLIEGLKDVVPLVGIGIPGVKSKDKRGIVVANNGPRIPRFLDVLEHRLDLNGHAHHPIKTLENDSDCCGVGELYSEHGLFRDIESGLFLGSGTGISDSILLNGKLMSFDEIETWMPKTWQIKNARGIPIESLISYKGLITQYSKLTKTPFSKLVNNNIFPEQFLKTKVANSIKTEFVSTISYLILERIEALFLKKPDLKFDNIILGLRFVHMLKEIPELLIEIRKSVKNRVKNSTILNQVSKNHYIQNSVIIISKTPYAPAIGAGVIAYQNVK